MIVHIQSITRLAQIIYVCTTYPADILEPPLVHGGWCWHRKHYCSCGRVPRISKEEGFPTSMTMETPWTPTCDDHNAPEPPQGADSLLGTLIVPPERPTASPTPPPPPLLLGIDSEFSPWRIALVAADGALVLDALVDSRFDERAVERGVVVAPSLLGGEEGRGEGPGGNRRNGIGGAAGSGADGSGAVGRGAGHRRRVPRPSPPLHPGRVFPTDIPETVGPIRVRALLEVRSRRAANTAHTNKKKRKKGLVVRRHF
jgi:hypothetical protein